ncbi:isochorismate hydrolase [Catenulispora sp. GP43]|uniref:isochorismatase family protein n=1 Tax=Catenulispora sp. GP43 TaxID=3156263 RepID=UPI003512FECB
MTASGIDPIEPYPVPTESELPVQRAAWSADPGRAVLLIHDMQEYFLRFFPAGREPLETVLRNAVRLREACADLGVPVVYTAQPGAMSPRQRGLLAELWGPGMGAVEADRAIVPELAPKPGDRVLTKWRYSAFHRTPLADVLWQTGRDQLIVCGVFAHIGCLTSCVDAFSRDVQAFLAADAVADFSAEKHRLALAMAAESCAATPTTDRLLRALAEAAR